MFVEAKTVALNSHIQVRKPRLHPWTIFALAALSVILGECAAGNLLDSSDAGRDGIENRSVASRLARMHHLRRQWLRACDIDYYSK